VIGVILKSLEAHTAFMTFRKQWYVETRFILDSREIDSDIDYIVSDTLLSVHSERVLIYGKDIKSFDELCNYVKVIPAIPIGKQRIFDENRIKEIMPDAEIDDETYNDLLDSFKELLYDSKEISELQFDVTDMSDEEIEAKKNSRISEVLAQRALEIQREREQRELEEKRNAELQAKKAEQERIEREEQERLKHERLLREAKEAEERAKREREQELIVAEKEKAEALHQKEMLEIKLETEKIKQQIEQTNKTAEQLAQHAEQPKPQELVKQVVGEVFTGLLNAIKVPDNYTAKYVSNASQQKNLHIGRKSNKNSMIYVFGGAQKDCGSSTIAYNFARTLCSQGKSTILVDLDLNDTDLSNLFNKDKIDGCSIDMSLRGIKFSKYIHELDDFVLKSNIGKVRVPFISCNSLYSYSIENRKTLNNYDFSGILMALINNYDNVVVDIGCIASYSKYQEYIMKHNDFTKFICYPSSTTSELNDAIKSVFSIKHTYSVILSKASSKMSRQTVEKKLRKPVIGLIPFDSRFNYDGVNVFNTKEETRLGEEWRNFVKLGSSS